MIPGEIGAILEYLFYSQIVLLPLGVWKLIDIILWIANHVHVGIN